MSGELREQTLQSSRGVEVAQALNAALAKCSSEKTRLRFALEDARAERLAAIQSRDTVRKAYQDLIGEVVGLRMVAEAAKNLIDRYENGSFVPGDVDEAERKLKEAVDAL